MWEFPQRAGVSAMPSLRFPLMPATTDVWEAWQCPSRTLETEMRRWGARSRGAGMDPGDPILPFIPSEL